MLKEGLSHTSSLVVTESLTAESIGSGDMPVLATPAMTALMENAAMLSVAGELEDGQTTVGGHISSSHLRPSAVGQKVEAEATLTRIDGRKLYFRIVARMGETVIGEGDHLRFIVDHDRFLAKL